jgi:hypothetical protein
MSFETGNQLGLKHGLSKTATYRKWVCMKWRCQHDKYYKSIGITFCKRWERFENFLADMGECPVGMEIDRKNTHRGYSPSNCRWATRLVNQRNRSVSINITFNGVTKCLKDWAAELGIRYVTLIYRLKAGWPVELAFTKQPKYSNYV